MPFCWRKRWPSMPKGFRLPRSRRPASFRPIREHAPSSPAKRCRVTPVVGFRRAARRDRAAWRPLFRSLSLVAARGRFPPRARDRRRGNRRLACHCDGRRGRAGRQGRGFARTGGGDVRARHGAGPCDRDFNRDLAAHNGALTFHGELLQKELDQRHMAPAFDGEIGRFRLPRRALEQALSLGPQTRQALRVRFSSCSKPASTKASCSIRFSSSA